jgi:alanine racemase
MLGYALSVAFSIVWCYNIVNFSKRQKGAISMRKLIIKKAAVKNNIKVVKERSGSAAIYAVLSGDGGGAGIDQLAHLLRDEGINRFAVSDVEEAEALRRAGFEHEEILMLRSTTDREELERLVDLNVVCTISSVDTGMALNALAENRSTVAEAHIQVDTGMGFGGFLVSEPEKILLAYRSLPNVALSGIYTQIHAAPKGDDTDEQLKLFHQVLDAIHEAGFETGTVHAAGSFAILHRDLARFDAVRAGSVLLGRCRRMGDDGLNTVGSGEVPLSEVRWLPKGHTVGVDKPVVLKKPTRVAVLPVGYQNGFGIQRPRDNGFLAAVGRWRRTRRASVLVGGQRARVIGRIGATETVINVTNLKCSAGDLATFDMDPLFARGFTIEYR